MELQGKTALIVGAGAGLSASLARSFKAAGLKIALAARQVEKLEALGKETGAGLFACDASDPAAVEAMMAAVEAEMGAPAVVVFNASARVRGGIAELDPEAVRQAITVSAFGGFLVARAAVPRMLAAGEGAILFTGASASVKGYARSSAFAMGKFALRGLAQSLSRELQPQNIHIAHFVIDGAIGRSEGGRDDRLDPDAIAATYLAVLRQPRSAWTAEVELRPWVETF